MQKNTFLYVLYFWKKRSLNSNSMRLLILILERAIAMSSRQVFALHTPFLERKERAITSETKP
ncbi:hypothetical protein H6G54_29970 [Anabaena cylindrica FACHB-243]|uniref:hypothetical protein n=1 Tax=Anabaena sp. PCC 7938 TaxID=1296340 RepID=UPI00199BB28E|nr:hypothetical protein [Anabaena sp. CCAP 1446/1C]MBD2421828.1 hypothetical protein [Anabaena cylindrica FACHB-243]MBY5281893.1 hypothetical protein [Anabaena sp. CCAP 1446/1C]MBY5306957.1 hypothetical protein [Anabaena sp. CCAP 1446/1C]